MNDIARTIERLLGTQDIEAVLREFDEAAFNAGFDAAVDQILGGAAQRNKARVNLHHPAYRRDRSAAYALRKSGEGERPSGLRVGLPDRR